MEGQPVSNSSLTWSVKFATSDWTFAEFQIVGGNLEGPEALQGYNPPKFDTRKGLIISGRGPQYLGWMLACYYNNQHPFVATYDPKLGVIVVASKKSGFPRMRVLNIDAQLFDTRA